MFVVIKCSVHDLRCCASHSLGCHSRCALFHRELAGGEFTLKLNQDMDIVDPRQPTLQQGCMEPSCLEKRLQPNMQENVWEPSNPNWWFHKGTHAAGQGRLPPSPCCSHQCEGYYCLIFCQQYRPQSWIYSSGLSLRQQGPGSGHCRNYTPSAEVRGICSPLYQSEANPKDADLCSSGPHRMACSQFQVWTRDLGRLSCSHQCWLTSTSPGHFPSPNPCWKCHWEMCLFIGSPRKDDFRLL